MEYRRTTKLARWALTALALSACGAAGAATVAADLKVRGDVENALSADPYFYGAHVNVSMENGNVVLRGFVFSDWDLRDAIRIANKAAAGRRVIDDLAIEVGGRR
jgi:osmotically-inducible protein OsmY